MKELRKRFLALVMGAVMIFGVGAFAGCNGGNKEQTPQTPSTGTTTPDKNNDKDTDKDNNKDTDKDTDKDNDAPSVTPDADKDQDGPAQTPAKTKAEAISAFNAAVQKIDADKNFTYTEIGAEYVAEFEGAKLKVTENGTSVFYATEGDQNYSYILRDSVWHKDFSETTAAGIFSALTAVLYNVIWSDFEAEKNLLSGTASGETVQATVTETALTVETAQKKFTLTKLGTTAVSLPADAVDDTDASNFIFTTDENGEIVWNVKAIKDVLEPWLKNEMTDANGNHVDNQFGRPVFARVNNNLVRTIIFINPAVDKLEFGYILDNPDGNCFEARHLWGWDNFVEGKTTVTKKDFNDFLLSLQEKHLVSTISNIDLEYTTFDKDYETAHKQEFETLTKNVFEKYHKEKDATDPDYTGAKIFFGFKGFASDMHLGSDGYGKEFSLHYLVERKDGTIELIETRVRGLTSGFGYLENILQNQEGKWSFEYPDKVVRIAEISTENLVLFDAPIMTIGKIA